MGIRTLYEGHYRALEDDFLQLAEEEIRLGGELTVVTAGSQQLSRLSRLLVDRLDSGVVCGIRFFPGLMHLAQKLSTLPGTVTGVSQSDRMLFSQASMESMGPDESLYPLKGNPAASGAMASFFEDLFDHGITPEIYKLSTLSIKGEPTETESIIGKLYTDYGNLRQKHYRTCRDQILQRDIPGSIEGSFILYGFYDLNPAQRRFIRRFLQSAARVFWFNPLDGNSQWMEAFIHTHDMLMESNIPNIIRSGGRRGLNDFAAFFESGFLQFKPAVPSGGFRVTAASGETGACRVVLDRLKELEARMKIPLQDIAVVRRKENGGSLARMAVHEGIPVSCSLTSRLVELPQGLFLLSLLDLEESDFHYSMLQRLVVSGMLRDEISPSASRVTAVAMENGIRLGRKKWRDWYVSREDETRMVSLLRKLDLFFDTLPDKSSPAEYLSLLKQFYRDTTDADGRDLPLDFLFDAGSIRFNSSISWKRFSEAFRMFLRATEVVIRSSDPDGFRILSIEEVRGGHYTSVILMDLEEDIYPGRINDDPRLSDDLRERLQLPRKAMRELADGYLLRQAGEAAGETLDIVYRCCDSRGRDIYPASYIAGIICSEGDGKPDPSWFRIASTSPVSQMLGGEHSGQVKALAACSGRIWNDPSLLRSIGAFNSRMNTSRFNEFDGVLDLPVIIPDICSPTMLENYMSCPFAYLVEKIWVIGEREDAGVSGSLPPSEIGQIIHRAFSSILRESGFHATVESVERILSGTLGLSGEKFGSSFLKQVFLRRNAEIITRSIQALQERNWRYLDSERWMEGNLGDLAIGGRVDLILEEDDGLVLVDLKTGNIPSKSSVGKGLSYQLPFYFQLAKQNYSSRDIKGACYVSVSSKSPGKRVGFTGDELENMMNSVERNAIAITGMMREGIFPPVPGGKCRYCHLGDLCRKAPEWRLEEKILQDDRMVPFREVLNND